jgi:excinuclease ABC subunit A
MSETAAGSVIRLRGVRHNNLKNFNLDLPLKQLIVITGLSGSGKSSLAFDTLFAEGQRRYIETFSPYARQFLDRMDKPQVDSIEGIPPAVAIEQRNTVKTTRSTVGTITEIADYMKVLWPHLAQLHCRRCQRPVRKDLPLLIWQNLKGEGTQADVVITFTLPLAKSISFAEALELISRQGYQRVIFGARIVRIEELEPSAHAAAGEIVVVQDRLRLAPSNRARFVEACEQAYHFGKGRLAIFTGGEPDRVIPAPRLFSSHLHCAECDIEYRDPSPALFSFNHPLGACPACRGFGRMISIDYNRAIPDRTKTLADGAVKPWQTGQGLESQHDLTRFCKKRNVPMDVSFCDLPVEQQRWVIEGDSDYGKDARHEWPHAWYGVRGYFRWLESKAYKMHVRVLLSRYRAYTPCALCEGRRFQPESLLFKVESGGVAADRRVPRSLTLADIYQLPIRDALDFMEGCAKRRSAAKASDPFTVAMNEVRSRLGYLMEAGLGYLTLDRPTRSLSGGETERVNLTTCLGSRLVNTLFVLDEPSVGLHARDTARLISILQRLREAGNTVVVVEHEASVIRAADQIIDLGPGHGATGGDVVFQGSPREILKARGTLTGAYLSGRKRIEPPAIRPVLVSPAKCDAKTQGEFVCPVLELRNASLHNLRNFSVRFPLGRFICVTGVSGSGKTTLIRDLLLPGLQTKLNGDTGNSSARQNDEPAGDSGDDQNEADSALAISCQLTGAEHLGQVVMVDQSPLGKTPRSNPAVYTGAFEEIRKLFARTELARQRGLSASAFSFNSAQGQCERCRGAGFEKIEMQFLSDVFIRCPECDGKRYRPHILEITMEAASADQARSWNIAQLLDATIDEGIEFLSTLSFGLNGGGAVRKLKLLQEVGLGYLRVGQPINTLSGGESQRLKLVRHLGEAEARENRVKPAIFLFDEPTTGLHFEDVRVLLAVFHRLVNAGHTVVTIEHNLDVIRSADWVIDLGPEAGDEGGTLVGAGTPAMIAAHPESHTGKALRTASGSE